MTADTGLRPLPPFGDSGRWAPVAARLEGRPFLRSEGMNAPIAPPQVAAPWLVEQSRELVAVFHRFYRAVVDAEGALADEPARGIGEPYEAMAAAEGRRDPLPLGRYDCVLERDGTLRVIELNPVGVCTLHLRAVAYLARLLERMGAEDPALREAARAIDAFRGNKVASMRSFVDATLAAAPARPTIGLVLLPNMHRGSKVFWRHELTGAGFDVVLGRPDDVAVEGGRARLAGRPVDAMWLDWFFYLGYQQQRYEQTRFASKVGDYSKASLAAERVLRLPGLMQAVADRSLTILSPTRAYRALSKALLAWIERPALAISEADRTFLRAHVARTHDHVERERGLITPEQARARREQLLLKPCRFGGSHGVAVGRDVDADAWARRLDEIWTDPEWVLQAFSDPVSDGGGRLSFGLYDYGGELGGILVRAAPELVVSARTSSVIAVVPQKS